MYLCNKWSGVYIRKRFLLYPKIEIAKFLIGGLRQYDAHDFCICMSCEILQAHDCLHTKTAWVDCFFIHSDAAFGDA